MVAKSAFECVLTFSCVFFFCARFAPTGVHCTHGFNRTGYLICCYMVEVLDMAVEDAVEMYAGARPDGIYKDHYIQQLFTKYGGDVCITVLSAYGIDCSGI